MDAFDEIDRLIGENPINPQEALAAMRWLVLRATRSVSPTTALAAAIDAFHLEYELLLIVSELNDGHREPADMFRPDARARLAELRALCIPRTH